MFCFLKSSFFQIILYIYLLRIQIIIYFPESSFHFWKFSTFFTSEYSRNISLKKFNLVELQIISFEVVSKLQNGDIFLRWTAEPASLRLLPLLGLQSISLVENKVVLDDTMEIHLDLYNNSLQSVHATTVLICYKPWTEQITDNDSSRSRGSSLSSMTSVESSILHHQLTNIPIDTPQTARASSTEGCLSPTGVVYSDLLPGKLYSQSLPKEKELVKEDYTNCLRSDPVELKPGVNRVILKGKVGGSDFCLFFHQQTYCTFGQSRFDHSVTWGSIIVD